MRFFAALLSLAALSVEVVIATTHHRRAEHAHLSSRRRALPRSGNRLDKRVDGGATLKCLSDTSFAMCDGDDCTEIGQVADGTICKDGAITWSDSQSASQPAASVDAVAKVASSSSSSTAPAGSTSSSFTWSAPSSSSTTTTTTTSYSAPSSSSYAAPTTTSSKTTTAPSSSWSPSSSSWSPPTSSSTWTTSSSSTAAAAPSSSSGSSSSDSSSSSVFTGGSATFYTQQGAAGACGHTHSDSDMIVALASARFGSGSDCGRTVKITNDETGASTTATVADSCPGCSTYDSLDCSTAVFDAIADQSEGIVSISWEFTS
ncbi:hypothetical protein JCM8097_009253 [Rhodosporidiobolus ruineniae]